MSTLQQDIHNKIKFRAYDKKAKQMFIVREMAWLEGGLNVTDGGSPLGGFDCEIMRFTGLLDKQGVEIYENDFLKFTDFDYNDNDTQHTGVVKFSEGGWKLWNKKDDQFYEADAAFDLFWVSEQDEELEVIGNIYENKELV